ncbi:MAG: DUF4115 domain-containing protein [Oculatellaceae cyanobacterium Prado106]|jgi:cytoskeletal protein RodZ|nr:DUF4115 domain-containing protein [Oculatellaceae cyanobacterium Prado106]
MTRETSLLQQQEQQGERLEQIGDYLRQVREESFLSLEEVSTRTLIQPRLLQAIETGKLQQLPEPVYIQGFIRRYAEALGLDGSEFADAFPVTGQVRPAKPPSWRDVSPAQLRPVHLYVAYIGLIMLSVSLLSLVVSRSTPLASTVNRSSVSSSPLVGAAQKTTETGGAIASPNTSTTSPAARPAPGQPVRIDVKLTAQSWLQIESDGETEYEGVLTEGTERTWTAKSQIRVRAGNAGGVMVAYNGKQAQPLGEPGAVEEKVFAPEQSAARLPESGVAPAQ